jgi:general secretion pathway protein A
MYLEHFGLDRFPFTIAPDPSFLFPSPGHQEGLAHLQYSLTGHGGLICLTGEVGTGKTTLCRAFLNQTPGQVRTAYVFNPQLSAIELLQALCDELSIAYTAEASQKQLYDRLNQQLLLWYANGERVIVVIDEAQSMPPSLLEQIRLLTNLETDSAKLLTLILVGQPELNTWLQQPQLRQLNQRITARYHLQGLQRHQVMAYLDHRMQAAGAQAGCFSRAAAMRMWRASGGVPRLLNALADRALLGAYAHGKLQVTRAQAMGAEREVLPSKAAALPVWSWRPATLFVSVAAAVAMAVLTLPYLAQLPSWQSMQPDAVVAEVAAEVAAEVDAEFDADSADPVARLAHQQGLAARSCDELVALGWQCLWVDWPLADIRAQRFPALVQGVDWRWRGAEQASSYPNNYQGQALILWQPPAGYNGLLRPGERSALVPWLRQRLGMDWQQGWQTIAPSGQAASLPQDLYDPLLANRVAQFQARQGLSADRIIGPRTVIALQSQARMAGEEG